MKQKFLVFWCMVSLLTGCTANYELSLGDDDFHSSRLARIDQVIQAAVAGGEIPGAVVLVSRGGDTDLLKAYGFADLESNKVMQTDAIFRIASMTKMMTTSPPPTQWRHRSDWFVAPALLQRSAMPMVELAGGAALRRG